MKNKKYYLGWGWGTDEIIEPNMGEFDTYEEALKEAKKSHKEEIEYQREECDNYETVMNTYVFLYEDGQEYKMAEISGLKSRVEEYEWED